VDPQTSPVGNATHKIHAAFDRAVTFSHPEGLHLLILKTEKAAFESA